MVSGAIFLASAVVWLIASVLAIAVLIALWPLLVRAAKWLLIGGGAIGLAAYLGNGLLDELGLTWKEASELLGNGAGWLIAISVGSLLLWAITKGSRDIWKDRKLNYTDQEAVRRKALGYDD